MLHTADQIWLPHISVHCLAIMKLYNLKNEINCVTAALLAM